jgi:hypothetical protein
MWANVFIDYIIYLSIRSFNWLIIKLSENANYIFMLIIIIQLIGIGSICVNVIMMTYFKIIGTIIDLHNIIFCS